MSRRLFIVSNRLPLTIESQSNGYVCRQSSGGLISAISAYLEKGGKGNFKDATWVGVPGCSREAWECTAEVQADYTFMPVFMDDSLYEPYYNGLSNSLLWPLFHYFPSFADYDPENFDAYMAANRSFCGTLLQTLRKDDVVWIHDYHLLPLAGMLREQMPTLTIGFFLHIPFPSFELFRVMPKQWQRLILTGMLGADLIGFHTIEYSSHFLSCLTTVLKIEHDGQYISWDNRQIKVDAFPISIDFDRFHEASDNLQVREVATQFQEVKGDRKMIFSVDRLDYTKGISNRLKGYERFLMDNPDYQGKVVFALNVVPSRDSITKYAERKKMIDEFIGNLNSRLGSITWQPIIYQYNHLSFEELTAMYITCDLALITPLRDGMNLVAKEFTASRKDGLGVLVLSEMAGASKELTEALLINPNDTGEIASMIKRGLEMTLEEQHERIVNMQDRVRRYDVVAWATDFFDQLMKAKADQFEFEIKFIDTPAKIDLLEQYRQADSRLMLLDYDGSLVPFSKFPAAAKPDPEVVNTLLQLSKQRQNEVYIVSGRDSITLEAWLGHLSIGLIAEHGAKIRHKDGSWENAAATVGEDYWKTGVIKIMEHYISKCPHSFIEQKEFSLAWHFRNADLREGAIRAKELYEELLDFTTQLPLQVLQGNKVIEVRMKGINKGVAVASLLDKKTYDFILAIGDDKTDEDMFVKLVRTPGAFTIKVGNEASFAKYNLHTPAMVQSLLQSIALSEQMESLASRRV